MPEESKSKPDNVRSLFPEGSPEQKGQEPKTEVERGDELSPADKALWAAEETNYSPYNFYTGSKDPQGHSTFHRIRTADHVSAQMNVLVASKEIKQYKTVADIWRDSARHRLHWLRENMPPPHPQLDRLEQLIAIEDDIEVRERLYDQVDQILTKLIAVGQKMLSFNDKEALNQMVEESRASVEALLKPDEYDKILTHFDKRVQESLKAE